MSVSPTDLAGQTSREDERALERIYRDYHQPLYRFCLAIVGNRQDAEDALQNTMVKVLRALPGEDREIALKPWLYRIAHNESIDQLRRRRENVSLDASAAGASEPLAVQVEARDRLRNLIADLDALPGRQRQTLLMREAAGLSFEEIGVALETSPAVARQTLYEARLGLRQMDAGREMKCESVTKALSDGDGRVRRRRDIRAHLRDCAGCRHFAAEIDSRHSTLAAISPLPAVAAAAMLQGLVGGGAVGGAAAGGAAAGAGGGVGAGGVGGLLGGAAVKSVGTATLLKGAATVAVVAAIGVGAADRGGLIQLGGGSGAPAPAGAEPKNSGPEAEANGSVAAEPEPSPAGASDDSSPKVGAKRDLGQARAASQQKTNDGAPVAAEPVPTPTAQGPQTTVSPPEAAEIPKSPPGKPAIDHPSGRGHAKQTPAAAAHGQETAAAHHPQAPNPGNTEGSDSASGKGKSAEAPGHSQQRSPSPQSAPAAPKEPKQAKAPPGKQSK